MHFKCEHITVVRGNLLADIAWEICTLANDVHLHFGQGRQFVLNSEGDRLENEEIRGYPSLNF